MWKNFVVDSKQYFFNMNYDNNLFTVRLTDLIVSWKEVSSIEIILERFKESNSIEGTVEIEKVISAFDTNLNPQNSEVIKTIKIDGDKCNLTLVSNDISINLNLLASSQEDFYKDITLPLILIVQELSNRQEKLKQILKDKDDEIAEYQLEGGKLFRKYLQTKSFDDTEFQEECNKSTEMNLSTYIREIDKVFNIEVNSLYSSAVKACENYSIRVETNAKGIEKTKDVEKPTEDVNQSKGKNLKWELGPQNVKRFKAKRSKINL